jgi:sec-independent protein translocase protein TatC
MFVIMIPLYLMYEISIWVAFLFGGKESSSARPEPSASAP